MPLDISSKANIIKNSCENFCTDNFVGDVRDGKLIGIPRGAFAATLQNLSSCWVSANITLMSDKTKDVLEEEYCLVFAPGQVKNLTFEGESIRYVYLEPIQEPDNFGKADCSTLDTLSNLSESVLFDFQFFSICDSCLSESQQALMSSCVQEELICPPDILATDRSYPVGIVPTGALPCGGDTTTGNTGTPIKYICECGEPTISYTESFAAGHWYYGDGPPPIIPPATAAAACTYTILRSWSITDTCDTEFCGQIIHVDKSIMSASSYNFLAIHPSDAVVPCSGDTETAALGLAKLIDYDTDTLLFSAGTAYNGFDCNISTKNSDFILEYLCGFTADTGPRVVQRTFVFHDCSDPSFSNLEFTSAYQRITLVCSGCTAPTGYCDNFDYSITRYTFPANKFTVNNIVTPAATYKFQLSNGSTDTIEYNGSNYKVNGSNVTLPFDITISPAGTNVDWTLVEYNGIPVSNLCIRITS